MKGSFASLLLCSLLGASGAQAATEMGGSSSESLGSSVSPVMTSSGFTVGIFKSFGGKVELEAEGFGQKMTAKEDIDQKYGFYIGYDYIKTQTLGVRGGLSFNQYGDIGDSSDDIELRVLRGEGNLTYGANEYLYLYGGLNVQRILNSEVEDNFETGFGLQGGVGAKFTPNFGATFGYSLVRHKIDSINGIDAHLDISSLDLMLNATF